jgi:D-threonate/D-erythronate kinase
MGSLTGKTRGIVTIADDLTGACDAAIHFADIGLATFVGLHFNDEPPVEWESWAVNTDTRSCGAREAAERVLHAFEEAKRLRPQKVVKKIDSMMRGNIAAEVAAACRVLEPRLVILTPAFPALGRTVRDGRLFIHGQEDPVAIADRLEGLRCAVLRTAAHEDLAGEFAQAAAGEIDVLIPDTSSQDELRRIVRAAAGIENLLWVGSGGLASAIASTMGSPGKDVSAFVSTPKPVLTCVGSNHGATLAQLKNLEEQEHAVFVEATTEGFAEVAAALRQERNVVLLLERRHINQEALREFAESVPIDLCGGLVLTGGDTALQVLDALGARCIRLYTEILPGIPQGTILGGLAHGLLAVTKSGAFGSPDALSRSVQMLRPSPVKTEMQSKETFR